MPITSIFKPGAQQHFTDHLGIVTTSPEPGRSEGVAELQPHHLNRAGTAHGGFLMTMLDTLMGRAVFTHLNSDKPDSAGQWFATSRLNAHFLDAATGGTLTGTGNVLSQASGYIVAEAEIRDESGTLIATGQGQFTRVRGTG